MMISSPRTIPSRDLKICTRPVSTEIQDENNRRSRDLNRCLIVSTYRRLHLVIDEYGKLETNINVKK